VSPTYIVVMVIEFTKLNERQCVLCGAYAAPTGEHKIKASVIKSEFGAVPLSIVGDKASKFAQSPRSKAFHFGQARLCRECNSSRSQPGDRAFDELHSKIRKLRSKGADLTDETGRPNVELSETLHLDSFRYFAKILCCFIAEVRGPRSRSLSSFAIGRSNINHVLLRISNDIAYESNVAALGSSGLVSHGGLVFEFDKSKKWVNTIRSSLLAGGIQYEFWVQLRFLSKLELRIFYADLIRAALGNIVEP